MCSHDPAGAAAITAITSPVTTPSGTRVPGLRFTDERVQALPSALCAFRLLPNGFTNRDLRTHLAPLLGRRYEDMTSGQITYDRQVAGLRRYRAGGCGGRDPAGMLQAGCGMLEQLLAADPGYRGPRVPCGQGHEAEFVSYPDKVIDTVLGAVTLTHAWYHCAACGHGFAPRDAGLGGGCPLLSPGQANTAAGSKLAM